MVSFYFMIDVSEDGEIFERLAKFVHYRQWFELFFE